MFLQSVTCSTQEENLNVLLIIQTGKRGLENKHFCAHYMPAVSGVNLCIITLPNFCTSMLAITDDFSQVNTWCLKIMFVSCTNFWIYLKHSKLSVISVVNANKYPLARGSI
jgi:hypothetical protein